MSETTTTARPYARAVFEFAKDKGDYAKWSEQVAFMAAASQDQTLRALLDNPRLTREARAELFIKACGEQIDENARNLVKLLAENDRFDVLIDVAALYEMYRAEAEGEIDAQIVSALEIDDKQKTAIAKALKARFGREVNITTRIDESLIGGAVIHAGDLVIDGSIRGRLDKLTGALNR